VDQGGLSLPDRDYYLKDDERFASSASSTPGHVQKMFELLGDPSDVAAREAQTVLDIETGLARSRWSAFKRREPRTSIQDDAPGAAALAPRFDLERYFTSAGAPAFSDVNVTCRLLQARRE